MFIFSLKNSLFGSPRFINKVIAPPLRCIRNRDAPFLATVLEPVLKLLGDIAQTVASHPLGIAIGIKETDYSLELWKG